MASNETSLENLDFGRLFTPESIAAIKPIPDTGKPVPEGLRPGYADYDTAMQWAHECMYRGVPAFMALTSSGTGPVQKVQDAEMMRLLGLPDKNSCVRYFEEHGRADPAIVNALLDDALASGKWKELPKALQDEYHKRLSERSVL